MSSAILNKLFGSKVRVKLLKFLFRNYPGDFSISELGKRIQEPFDATKKELNSLSKLGLINKK